MAGIAFSVLPALEVLILITKAEATLLCCSKEMSLITVGDGHLDC